MNGVCVFACVHVWVCGGCGEGWGEKWKGFIARGKIDLVSQYLKRYLTFTLKGVLLYPILSSLDILYALFQYIQKFSLLL